MTRLELLQAQSKQRHTGKWVVKPSPKPVLYMPGLKYKNKNQKHEYKNTKKSN